MKQKKEKPLQKQEQSKLQDLVKQIEQLGNKVAWLKVVITLHNPNSKDQ